MVKLKLAICGRKTGNTSDFMIFFSMYVYMGVKRSVLQSKRFVKMFKNMCSRNIKVEKNREITKTTVFPSFSVPNSYFHYFVKRFFPLNMAWKGGSFGAIFRKKKHFLAFFITKGHLRWIILILTKNVLCKYFLELKNALVFN